MVVKNLVVLSLIVSLFGCDQIKSVFTGYETYEHPSLRFRIDYPSNWKMIENGAFGTQVQFLSDDPAIFMANANIAVNKNPDLDLDELADLSVKQLTLLLRNYDLETKAVGTLGTNKAVDLRASYEGQEGKRKIRSVISIIDGMQYVFTFSCEAQAEHTYKKTVNKMIDSFVLRP